MSRPVEMRIFVNTAQQTALAQAKQGNPEALAALMRKQLEKKGIQVRVSRSGDLLTVALGSAQAPPKTSSLNFVKNGLTSLGVKNIRAVQVRAHKLGVAEPVWIERINLAAPPVTLPTQPPSQDRNDDSLLKISFKGKEVELDAPMTLGVFGCFLLVIGGIAPIIKIPVAGSSSIFSLSFTEWFLLMAAAGTSAWFIWKRNFDLLYGPAVASLLLILGKFWWLQHSINELKNGVDQELAGNPFRGLADVTMASIQLEWGWLLLFLGAAAALAPAIMEHRKLNRRAFTAIAISVAVPIIIGSFQLGIQQVRFASLSKEAKNSEAKTYVGSMNRAQQANFLEWEKFASNMDDILLGIDPETENYKYEIDIAENNQFVVNRAQPKKRGLKAYAGLVAIQETEYGPSTQTIRCEAKRAGKKQVKTPIVKEDNLSCARGSSKI